MSLILKFAEYKDKFFVLLFFIVGFLTDGFFKGYWLIFLLVLLSSLIYIRRIKYQPIYPLFYIVSVFLSWLFSEFIPDFYTLCVELCCFIIFIYTAELNDENFIEFFRKLVFVIVIIVFIEMVSAKFFLKPFLFTSKNQNYTALFYILAFSLILDDKDININNILISIISWFGCFISLSRSGILALLFLTIIRFFKFRDQLSKLLFIFLLASLFAIMFRFDDVFKINDPKSYKRIDIYISTLKGFIKNPLFGWGPGSFEMIFERFKFPYYDGLCYYNHSDSHAHSHLLNIMSEYGIFTAFLFLIIIFISLKGRLKYTIIGFLIFFMIDSIFYNSFIRMIFFIVLGISYIKDNDILVNIKKIFLTIFILVFFYIVSKDRADLRIYYNAYPEIFSNRNIFRQSAIAEMVSFYSPYNAVVMYVEGVFYRLFQNKSEEKWLKMAIKIEPNFRNAYLELASFYLEEKKYDDFKKNLLLIDPQLQCYNGNFYSSMVCKFDFKRYNDLKRNIDNY